MSLSILHCSTYCAFQTKDFLKEREAVAAAGNLRSSNIQTNLIKVSHNRQNRTLISSWVLRRKKLFCVSFPAHHVFFPYLEYVTSINLIIDCSIRYIRDLFSSGRAQQYLWIIHTIRRNFTFNFHLIFIKQ